jgi:CheY-like chemotaxis protein
MSTSRQDATARPSAAGAVLVVDDDVDTRELLADVLRGAGYLVETAGNGRDALELLQDNLPLPRMILLDIEMPVMNGAEFRETQRKDAQWIRIPTVVMTGSREEPLLDLAVDDTLRKPFTTDDLLSIVARYCSH